MLGSLRQFKFWFHEFVINSWSFSLAVDIVVDKVHCSRFRCRFHYFSSFITILTTAFPESSFLVLPCHDDD